MAKNYELEILISGGTDASLAASVQRARREIDSLEKQAGLSSANIGESFGMSTKGIDVLGHAADRVFGGIVKGAKLAAGGIAAAIGASAAVGMGFESQMSTVEAISQASAADMEKLTGLAKKMGETTQFSAEEAGKGLEYMAMAGWKAQDMISGLPGIMYLAAASGEELGSVSDIVTDAMTAFGLAVSDSAHFSDVLAQASASSNTDVGMMGETFQYVAPVAGSFGYTIEDVAVATGLMANAGIKGEKAGTAMRTMFTNLAKPTKQMREYMDKLSISLVDSAGNMKPLRQQMQEMRKSFAGLTEAEKAEYAAGIAGKEGMSGLLALVNTSDADFEKLTQEIDNSAGAAQKMSEVRIDNLAGDLTLLKSAAQGTGIEIYGGMSEGLRGVTQDAAEWLTGFTGKLRKDMPTIQRQLKQFGSGIKEGFQPVLDFGGWAMAHPDVINGTLTGIVAAMGTFKTVQVAKNGIALLGKLSGMITAWPVAAFGLAAGAIVGIAAAVKSNNNRLKKEDMARRFGDISLSMKELDETARMIVDNGNMARATEAVTEMGKMEGLSQGFEEASDALDKLNWKIGMGFGLDEGDQEDYAASIDQMIKGAIDIVQQSQYTAQISVQALFGTGSTTGNDLISGFDRMYADINNEVQELGKQLGDAYSTAMQDGIIDFDEAQTIQNLQQKLAAITQQVSQAQTKGKIDRITAKYSGRELDSETFKNVQAEIQEAITEEKANQEQSADLLYATVENQLARGDITAEEYKNKKADIGNQLNEQTMLSNLQGLNWSTNAITDAYSDVFSQAAPEIMENFNQSMRDSLQTAANGNMVLALDPEVTKKSLGLKTMDKATRDGIAELWQGMQPAYEQLQAEAQRFREAGEAIPQQVLEGLNHAETVGMLAGDTNVISRMMGGSIADNPEFRRIVGEVRKEGGEIPEGIAEGIELSTAKAKAAVEQLGEETRQELSKEFTDMTVDGNVNIRLRSNIVNPIQYTPNESNTDGRKPAHNASGGLIDNPTLSWFAEDSPEMAIPIDGSARSIGLWKETGQMLGAYEAYEANNYSRMSDRLTAGMVTENNSSSFAPVYSPQIHISGGTGTEKEQVLAGLREGYEQFKEWMEQYNWEKYRAAF